MGREEDRKRGGTKRREGGKGLDGDGERRIERDG